MTACTVDYIYYGLKPNLLPHDMFFELHLPLWLKVCEPVKLLAALADWSRQPQSVTMWQVCENLNDQVPDVCCHVSAQRRFLRSYSMMTMDSNDSLYSAALLFSYSYSSPHT